MKKYLLSLLIVGLTFIGFSSADYELLTNVNFSSCNQYSVMSDGSVINGAGKYKVVVNDSYGRNIQYITFRCPNDGNKFKINGNNNFIFDYDGSQGGKCSFYMSSSTFNAQTCPSVSLYKYVPAFNFGGNTALTPIVSGLFSVFGELIPYVIYIGIGILIVTLGFYAIRWLVNWLYDKIKNKF